MNDGEVMIFILFFVCFALFLSDSVEQSQKKHPTERGREGGRQL